MGKLSKSDEQLSSMEQDSGQCSRNTSCETLGKNTEFTLQRHIYLRRVECAKMKGLTNLCSCAFYVIKPCVH